MVSSGLLPGVVQSNARAELYAVLQAVLSAPSGFIYSDSLGTVKGFQRLQHVGFSAASWTNMKDYDLWSRIFVIIRDDPFRWRIQWVPSHQSLASASSTFQAWCFWHNDVADAEAKKADQQRDEIFMYVHGTVCRQHETKISYRKAVLQLQLQTSELSKAAHVGSSRGPHLEKLDCMALQKERLGMMVHDVSFRIPNPQLPFQPGGYIMQMEYAQRLWAFLAKQQWVADTSGGSLAELYVLFLRDTGLYVPINIRSFEQPDLLRFERRLPAQWFGCMSLSGLLLRFPDRFFPYNFELFGIFLKVFFGGWMFIGRYPRCLL